MEIGTVLIGILIVAAVFAVAILRIAKQNEKKSASGGGGGYTNKPGEDIETEETPKDR